MNVDERIQYVRVGNRLDVAFTDRFNGVPVTIAPGCYEDLPLEVATHLFGHDLSNRDSVLRHISRRQGWNTPDFVKPDDTGKTKAQQWFGKLEITPVVYKLVPAEDPDPRKPVPADPELPEKRRPGRPPVTEPPGAAA